MALASNDPSALANAAACFGCIIPAGDQLAVQTYLWALIAGADTSRAGVQSLVNSANCFACIVPPGMQLAVQNYLLTQLLAGQVIQGITIYDEDVEWAFATSTALRLTGNSALSPHTGRINIAATNAASTDFLTLSSPAPVVLSNYTSLSLWFQPVSWSGTSFVTLSFESGNTITLGAGTYGLDVANPAYQNVIIPIADFGLATGVGFQTLTLVCLPKITMNFYLDTITLVP